MRKLSHKSPIAHGQDYWFLFDNLTEMAKHVSNAGQSSYWHGGSFAQLQQWAITGRNDLVAASEAYMAKFEKLAVYAPRSRVIDDVAGAVPNVPAYLAGYPLAMRRRQKVESEQSPITIVLDTTVSAAISTDVMQKRAACLLAINRIVSAYRPIELWAGIGLGNSRSSATFVFVRVETAPLDLARAAFMLGHAGYTRGLGYQAAYDLQTGTNGSWPHGQAMSQEQFEKTAALVFPGTLLAINGTHISDKWSQNPEAWMSATLKRLGVLS